MYRKPNTLNGSAGVGHACNSLGHRRAAMCAVAAGVRCPLGHGHIALEPGGTPHAAFPAVSRMIVSLGKRRGKGVYTLQCGYSTGELAKGTWRFL
jgi:hypothetical protein